MLDFDPFETRDVPEGLEVEYCIQTDDGQERMTYEEYLGRPDLMELWGDRRHNNRLLLGRNVFISNRRRILQDKRVRDFWEGLREEKEKWGLKWYAPSGPSAIAFLNDWESDVKAIRAGNQKGKCNTYETVIRGVDADKTIGQLWEEGRPFRVWSWNGRKPVVAWATAPFKKPGQHECYKIRTPAGEFTCADEHRILHGDQFFFVSQLVSLLSLRRTISGIDLSVHGEGDHHWSGREADFPGCYSEDSYPCDERLLPYAICGQEFLPLSHDVPGRSHWHPTADVPGRRVASSPSTISGRPSNSDVPRLGAGLCRKGFESSISCIDAPPRKRIRLDPRQSVSAFSRRQSGLSACLLRSGYNSDAFLPLGDEQMGYDAFGSGLTPMKGTFPASPPLRADYSLASPIRGEYSDRMESQRALEPPMVFVDALNNILSCNKVGRKEVYDFHVPGHENYINAGLVHHNTTIGIIDNILDLIPCDPAWPIFSEYGVRHRPWRGGIKQAALSYKMQHHIEIIWPRFREWLPSEYIEDYLKRRKAITWDRYPHVELGDTGSVLLMRAYSQGQDVFAGPTWTRVHWDEQGTEKIFDECDERVSTQGWTPQHIFTLTPHELEGREDTGAGGWIEKLLTGEDRKEKNLTDYVIHPDHVPDFVYPEAEKAAKKRKWITGPLRTGNTRVLREGRSRYYGDFHHASGLVYSEWQREVHYIDPFPIPKDWTRYRAIDHGTRHPFVCLWGAVSPGGFLYVYREYYQKGKGIDWNVEQVIELSGNVRLEIGKYEGDRGLEFPLYEERMVDEEFEATVLDPRSFSGPDGRTSDDLSQVYQSCGLWVKKAVADVGEKRYPKVKAWLEVQDDLLNPITGEMGSPRAFVFNTCHHFREEIEKREWVKVRGRDPDKNPREKAQDKWDHTQNAFEYMIFIPPLYYPPVRNERVRGRKARSVNARTGY